MSDPAEPAAHLAVLDVVEHALGVAVRALISDYPALIGEPPPFRAGAPDERAARRLMHRLIRLEHMIARYRCTLPPLLDRQPAGDRDDADS